MRLFGLCLALTVLASIDGSPAHAAQECRDISWGSGENAGTTRMCKGADGKWTEVSTTMASGQAGRYDASDDSVGSGGAPNSDAQAEVEYHGTFEQTVTIPSNQGANTRNVLGAVLNNALNTKTERSQGAYTITAKLNGAASTAVFSGTGLQTITTSGTRNGGYCRFFDQTERGYTITYEGHCSPQGFSGTVSATGRNGARLQGRFETTATKYVDVAERERAAAVAAAAREKEAAAARLAAEREVASAGAALAAKPNASPAMTALLERAVQQDSGAWVFNRYDAGSIRNVKVLQSGAKTRLRGDYTYNDGSDGWVEADVASGRITCLSYWDVNECQPLRTAATYQDSKPTRTNASDPKSCLTRESFGNGKKERNDAVFYGTTNYVQRWGLTITNICPYSVSFELYEGGIFGPTKQSLKPGGEISCEDSSACSINEVTRIR